MKFYFILLITIAMFFFNSCEDDPSSVGQGLIDDQDVAKFYVLDSNEDNISISSGEFIADINYTSSRRLLVGAYDNLQSSIFIKFRYNSVPDSVREAIEQGELTIENSNAMFNIDYNIGDTQSNNIFTAHKINNDWFSDSLKKDNLAEVQFDQSDLGMNTYSYTDSTVTFDIDNQLSLEWLKQSYDDDSAENYGMLLKPNPAANRIIGFPALSSSFSNDQLPSITSIIKFSDGSLDTIVAIVRTDVHVVEGDMPTIENNYSLVQSGLPVRTKMLFDLTKLPKTAVVVEADLTVRFDTLNSNFGSVQSDSLVLTLLTDFDTNEVDSTYFSLVLRRDSSVYDGDIKNFIQLWIDEEQNNGMQLRLSDEDRGVSKLLFFNENNDVALKPHLKIIYTDIK